MASLADSDEQSPVTIMIGVMDNYGQTEHRHASRWWTQHLREIAPGEMVRPGT
jgi:hypothetical protein